MATVITVATPGPQGPTGPMGNVGPTGPAGFGSISTVLQLGPPTIGSRALVTDASISTFGALVIGGGALTLPVFADGLGWRLG